MKVKIKRIFIFMMIAVTCLCMRSMNVSAAASADTSVSAKEAEVGSEVVLNISIKSRHVLGTYEIYVQYDSEKLVVSDENSDDLRGGGGRVVIVGGANTTEEKSQTYKIKFIANKAGNAEVNVSGSAYYYDENTQEVVDMKVNTSTTKVKISSPSTASKDNTLSDLTIQTDSASGQSKTVKLDPEFSPDVTEYHTTLTYDVNKIVVSATQSDPNAKVEISGTRMDLGDNTTKITVTAEDGSKKEYVIYSYKTTEIPDEDTTAETEETTTRPAKAEKNIYIDSMKKYLIVNFSGVEIPEGFEESTFSYNNKSVNAARGISKNLTLAYLADDEELTNGAFYIYDDKNDSFYKMTNIQTDKILYTIIKTPDDLKIPKGFKRKKVKIDKTNVDSWVLEGNDDFYLVYAMNYNGDTGLYVYDRNEGTMQRYIEAVVPSDSETGSDTGTDGENSSEIESLYDTIDNIKQDYRKDRDLKWKIILALLVVSVILVIMTIVLLNKLRDVEIIEEDEEDDENGEGDEEHHVPEEHRELKLDMAVAANEMSSGALAANIEDIVREELGEMPGDDEAEEDIKEAVKEEPKEEQVFVQPIEPVFVQPAEMKIVTPEVFEQVAGLAEEKKEEDDEENSEAVKDEFSDVEDELTVSGGFSMDSSDNTKNNKKDKKSKKSKKKEQDTSEDDDFEIEFVDIDDDIK